MGHFFRTAFYCLLLIALEIRLSQSATILTPPLFNLADGRRVYATATCGEGIPEPELYCKLVGANADGDVNINLIQGQVKQMDFENFHNCNFNPTTFFSYYLIYHILYQTIY